MRPLTHIQQRTGLGLCREYPPTPQETGGPRVFVGLVAGGWGGGGDILMETGGREEVWDVEQLEHGLGWE